MKIMKFFCQCITSVMLLNLALNVVNVLTVNEFLKNIIVGPSEEILEEAHMDAVDLIRKYGYPAESHMVQTTDGFNLITHRIPHGKFNKPESNTTRIPVLLLHGMNCESTQWFDNAQQSLGFVLADEGYDVWMGNMRGSSYTNHTHYTRDMKEFWDYSFEDHAVYDLPPIVDDILNKTGHSRMFYVGHSMGTTILFVMLAEKPEYNSKFAGNIALMPVLKPRYLTTLLRPPLLHHEAIMKAFNFFGQYTWLAMSPTAQKLTLRFCPSSDPAICEAGVSIMTGYNPYLRNRSRMAIFAIHCSTGTALKNLAHYGQIFRTSKPARFNYGPKENMVHYGSVNPPEYNVSGIAVPTVLFYTANDAAATPLDVILLKRMLPNVVGLELVPNAMAVHADVIWAKNTRELCYDKILEYMKKLWN